MGQHKISPQVLAAWTEEEVSRWGSLTELARRIFPGSNGSQRDTIRKWRKGVVEKLTDPSIRAIAIYRSLTVPSTINWLATGNEPTRISTSGRRKEHLAEILKGVRATYPELVDHDLEELLENLEEIEKTQLSLDYDFAYFAQRHVKPIDDQRMLRLMLDRNVVPATTKGRSQAQQIIKAIRGDRLPDTIDPSMLRSAIEAIADKRFPNKDFSLFLSPRPGDAAD